jgi:outer membrane scaffolding protein for murein synthesis (MipA/OmpV family)
MPAVREQIVKSTFKAAIGGLILAGAAGAAQAEPVTFFGYILNASISAQYAPTYEGGKHYTVFPGGSLAITKPWDFDAFAPPDDAASFGILNTKHVQFGLALSVRENRYNDDELQGMRSIGWALQGGGFMNIWPTHWIRIHVEGLKGVTSESGVVVNTGLDFVHHPKDWNLSIGPRYSWGDAKFNGTYFGVTPAEALASPYLANPFHAGAGSHYAGVEAMAEYKWRPRWRITFNANYNRLLGDDANSPLTRQLGTPNQFGVGTGIRFMLQD